MRAAGSQQRFVISVLAIYGLVSAAGLYHHELFLDEAHHFLVSRDSGSLADMYRNLRYDGHPRLWGALLFLVTHYVTASPAGMQALQWLFAMSTAFVLLRYGPFDRWTKLLILAGYYFIFEFDVLSRDYAIGIWMLFLCCHLLRRTETHAVWIGCIAFLMCNAHLFFAFAAGGILVYLVAARFEVAGGAAGGPAGGRRAEVGRRSRFRYAAMIVLIVLGLAAALMQERTPADDVNMAAVHPAAWLTWENASFAMNGLVQGWLPIPQVNGGRFWNTSWLTAGHLGRVVPDLLFAALFLFPACVLGKRWPALLFYYCGVGCLLVLLDVTHMGANRYFGMVFVYFLAAAWLTADGTGPVLTRRSLAGSGQGAPGAGWRARGRQLWWMAWTFILVVQVLVGWYAIVEDFRRPFSQSRNAADYLAPLRAAGLTVVVDGYTAGPMLCAYLEQKLYYLDIGATGSFCVWRKEFFPVPRPAIGTLLAGRPELRNLGDFILVSNRQLGADKTPGSAAGYRLIPLKSFEHSISGENYFIYRVEPTGDTGASPALKPAL